MSAEHDAPDPDRAPRVRHGARGQPLAAEAEQEPERVAEDRKGNAEMRGEPVLADIGAVDETALHHVPADGALEAAENEESDQPRQKRARDIAEKPEADEWHEKSDADQPAEKAMRPFPPIDGLELVEAHAALELGIFGDLLIGLEGLLPVGLGERRHGAHDRLPLGDGEARIGEPRGAADQDHGDDQSRDRAEPQPQRANMAWFHGGIAGGRHQREDMAGLIAAPAPGQLRPLPHTAADAASWLSQSLLVQLREPRVCLY